MTFTEAAVLVLRLASKPLHFKEITDIAIERSLLSHVGKNPEVTMGARLSAQVKKNEKDNPLARVKPGVFALSEWDEKKVAAGLADRTPVAELVRLADEAAAKAGAESPATSTEEESAELTGDESPGVGEASESAEGSEESSEDRPAALDTIVPPPDEEERHRAELSAAATELFAPEDDDDQPIFGVPDKPAKASSSRSSSEEDDEPKDGRKRRRRRRGKRRDGDDEGDDELPAYTVSEAPSEEVLAEVLDEPADFVGEGQNVRLAGQLAQLLSKYDPSRGLVSAQNVADSLKKSGNAERSLGLSGVLAVAVADNHLRQRAGETPLFRVIGGKLGLTSWSFDKRGAERLRTLDKTAAELRASTVRGLADQLGRMPQRAFGELVLVLLDRLGIGQMSSVKRPGTHGAELHFAARAPHASFGIFPDQPFGEGVPIAVCVRRDGKDVGRERVTELRGALHHYEGASLGWLITAGQVLSGARDEASSPGGSPMVLIGRVELAELCVRHGVGVKTHRVEIPLIDAELFDSFPGR